MITFLHVGEVQPWAEVMVARAQKITGQPVIQLTDNITPAVKGVDGVRRRDYDRPLMPFRLKHLSEINEPHLTLDSDVLLIRNIWDVWEEPFDVALTYRNQPLTLTITFQGQEKGADIASHMPINTGVMFSRTPEFWVDCLKWTETLPGEKLNWWGDQMAVAAIANSGKYAVKRLECTEYNWTPSRLDHYEGAKAVHFKGTRKHWMSQYEFC